MKDEAKQNRDALPYASRSAVIQEAAFSPASETLCWELLEDAHEKVRVFAVKHLSELDNLDSREVRKKLSHHHWYVRCAVLDILGRRKDSGFMDDITPLTHDHNAEVRKTTARVLGEIGGKESLKLLMELLRDEHRFVRAEAERGVEKASRLKFT